MKTLNVCTGAPTTPGKYLLRVDYCHDGIISWVLADVCCREQFCEDEGLEGFLEDEDLVWYSYDGLCEEGDEMKPFVRGISEVLAYVDLCPLGEEVLFN